MRESENPKPLRRLAAILATDIAGYSTLMGADEARTVRDQKDHLAVVLPIVSAHGGRVIRPASDGTLAEYAARSILRALCLLRPRICALYVGAILEALSLLHEFAA